MKKESGPNGARPAIDPLYTIKTVAEMLGVHQNTIYGLIRDGCIEAFRVGKRSIRVSGSSVRLYLVGQKIDSLDIEMEKNA